MKTHSFIAKNIQYITGLQCNIEYLNGNMQDCIDSSTPATHSFSSPQLLSSLLLLCMSVVGLNTYHSEHISLLWKNQRAELMFLTCSTKSISSPKSLTIRPLDRPLWVSTVHNSFILFAKSPKFCIFFSWQHAPACTSVQITILTFLR